MSKFFSKLTSTSEILLPDLVSITSRSVSDSSRLFSGPGVKLINGVPIKPFGKFGVLFATPTKNLSGTLYNSMSGSFSGSGEGYPSSSDLDAMDQPVFDGLGLGYQYFLLHQRNKNTIHSHNEVRTDFDKNQIIAFFYNDDSRGHYQDFLKFVKDCTEEHAINPNIIIYSTKKGGVFFEDGSSTPIIFPTNILTTNSWSNKILLEGMKESYETTMKEFEKDKEERKESKSTSKAVTKPETRALVESKGRTK